MVLKIAVYLILSLPLLPLSNLIEARKRNSTRVSDTAEAETKRLDQNDQSCDIVVTSIHLLTCDFTGWFQGIIIYILYIYYVYI